MINNKEFNVLGPQDNLLYKYFSLFRGNTELADLEIKILCELDKNGGEWNTKRLTNALDISHYHLNNNKCRLVKKKCIVKINKGYILNPHLKTNISSEDFQEFKISFIFKKDEKAQSSNQRTSSKI